MDPRECAEIRREAVQIGTMLERGNIDGARQRLSDEFNDHGTRGGALLVKEIEDYQNYRQRQGIPQTARLQENYSGYRDDYGRSINDVQIRYQTQDQWSGALRNERLNVGQVPSGLGAQEQAACNRYDSGYRCRQPIPDTPEPYYGDRPVYRQPPVYRGPVWDERVPVPVPGRDYGYQYPQQQYPYQRGTLGDIFRQDPGNPITNEIGRGVDIMLGNVWNNVIPPKIRIGR